jgi:hypothetical protein
MGGDFTQEQIDNACRMVVIRYGDMRQNGRRDFYKSSEDMIEAAASELVAEKYFVPALAKIAAREVAAALMARGGRAR